MQVVKRTEAFVIYKKRSGRFGVRTRTGAWINGPEKVKILVDEGLIKADVPSAEEPAPEETIEPVAEETPEAEAATP